MRRSLLLIALSSPFLQAPARADGTAAFTWHDGDRVVLIGDALIEREQRDGYIESLFTIRNPDKAITFRNLGWSGDTVGGVARARFGKPEDGYRHLVEYVLALRPTVLIVGYGMTDSFDGEAGLPRFRAGLNRLLDDLTETRARLIFVSPIAHENLGPPLPDPEGHNRSLRRYRDVLREIAGERHARFVDLFELTERPAGADRGPAMTDDGIHLNPLGYNRAARLLCRALGGDAPGPPKVVRKAVTPDGLHADLTFPTLPLPDADDDRDRDENRLEALSRLGLFDEGFRGGAYALSIDGRRVARADAAAWKGGAAIPLTGDPERDQAEALRRAIVEKNRLYFYRWRPQNETYLFGFRKHEQGNNAREIPLFDPLVEAKEREIGELKTPRSHVYEWVREGEEAK